jgi:hypothetical protein
MICPRCKGPGRPCALCEGSGTVTAFCNFCGKAETECKCQRIQWPKGPLQDVDFRNYDPIEMVEILKFYKKPGLEPLIHWVARGYAGWKANDQARIAIADGEREAERLAK